MFSLQKNLFHCSNVGPAVKPKSRKKTRAKKVAAKSQNGRDDDIVLDGT